MRTLRLTTGRPESVRATSLGIRGSFSEPIFCRRVARVRSRGDQNEMLW